MARFRRARPAHARMLTLVSSLCRPRKQMPNDPIQAMEFAQSKGQARKDGRTGVLFADVAGCDDALRKLGYVVEARHFAMRCSICTSCSLHN